MRTPFGGMKNSGVGREGGLDALRFLQNQKMCVKLWVFLGILLVIFCMQDIYAQEEDKKNSALDSCKNYDKKLESRLSGFLHQA